MPESQEQESQTRMDKIKCRFCDWRIPKWKTTKKGKHIERYSELLRHIEFQHPEKLQQMEEIWTQEKAHSR